MIYLIYGDQIGTIKNRIKRISNDSLGNIDELNFVRFDYNDIDFLTIIEEGTSLPLGYDKKVVSIENFLPIEEENKTLKNNEDYKKFLSFLKNTPGEIDIILSDPVAKMDEKSELSKVIKEVGKVFGLAQVEPKEWKAYCYKYITEKLGIEIDKNALDELALRTGGDVVNFQNHAAKLALYTNKITYDDVALMVEKPLEDNIFQIYNALISGKKDLVLTTYRDMKTKGVEPVTMISTLAKQFRTFHQVMYLSRKGISNKEIASTLAISEVRASILAREAYSINDDVICKAIDDLYELELHIKSGLVDRFYAFEMFLINFNSKL